MDSNIYKPVQGHQWKDVGSMCQAKMQVQKTSYLKLDYKHPIIYVKKKKKKSWWEAKQALGSLKQKYLYVNKSQANMWLTKIDNTWSKPQIWHHNQTKFKKPVYIKLKINMYERHIMKNRAKVK